MVEKVDASGIRFVSLLSWEADQYIIYDCIVVDMPMGCRASLVYPDIVFTNAPIPVSPVFAPADAPVGPVLAYVPVPTAPMEPQSCKPSQLRRSLRLGGWKSRPARSYADLTQVGPKMDPGSLGSRVMVLRMNQV